MQQNGYIFSVKPLIVDIKQTAIIFVNWCFIAMLLIDILSIQPCPYVQWFDSQQQNGYISSGMPLIKEMLQIDLTKGVSKVSKVVWEVQSFSEKFVILLWRTFPLVG